MAKLWEYARMRFVNPTKIIGANIYEKEEKDSKGQSTGSKILRVAIKLDVQDVTKSEVYSDPMPDYAAASAYVQGVPLVEQ